MSKRPFLIACLSYPLLAVTNLAAQCNSAPDAVADVAEYFGQVISFEPMWNDREPDGEALELTVVSHDCGNPPAGRSLTVHVENGTLRLLPIQPGYPTTCTVNYRIEDERGFTATADVQVRETSLFSDGFESGNTSRWSPSTPETGAGR